MLLLIPPGYSRARGLRRGIEDDQEFFGGASVTQQEGAGTHRVNGFRGGQNAKERLAETSREGI